MGRLQTDCNGREREGGREGAPPEGAEEVEEAASERQSGAEECSLHSATATNIATCLPLRATALLPRLLPGSAAENSKQAGKMRCLPSSTSVLVK